MFRVNIICGASSVALGVCRRLCGEQLTAPLLLTKIQGECFPLYTQWPKAKATTRTTTAMVIRKPQEKSKSRNYREPLTTSEVVDWNTSLTLTNLNPFVVFNDTGTPFQRLSSCDASLALLHRQPRPRIKIKLKSRPRRKIECAVFAVCSLKVESEIDSTGFLPLPA